MKNLILKKPDAFHNLIDLSDKIFSTKDQKEVLGLFAQSVEDLLNADLVILYEYNQVTNQLFAKPSLSGDLLEPENFTMSNKPIRKENNRIFEFLIDKKESYFETDSLEWYTRGIAGPPDTGKKSFIVREKIKSSSGFSLVARDEVVGLMFINFRKKHVFSEQEKDLSRFYANQVAVSIQKSRLERKHDLLLKLIPALRKTSDAVVRSKSNPKDVLSSICESARELSGADYTLIFPYDMKKKDFLFDEIATSGVSDNLLQKIHRPREEGITKEVIEHEIIPIDDVYDKSRFPFVDCSADSFIGKAGVSSMVGIRLTVDENPSGVLYVDFKTPNQFNNQDEIDILKIFSNHAAASMRIAHLFKESKRHSENLEVLSDIGNQINDKVEAKEEEILQIIYEQTGRVMDVTNFYIAFYDDETDKVSFKLAYENGIRQTTGTGEWKDRVGGNGLTEYLIRTKKSLLMPYRVKRFMEDEGINVIGSEAYSWVGAPMIYGEKVLGVIGVQTHDPKKENLFDETHEEILKTIASQAAIAIENSRLLTKSERQLKELDTLHETTERLISETFNIESVIQTILESAKQLLHADASQFLLLDSSRQKFTVVYTVGIDEFKDFEFDLHDAMVGQVYKNRKSFFTNDYFLEPYQSDKLMKYKHLLKRMVQIPLWWQGEIIGTLAVSTKPESQILFSKNDTDLLERFAGIAAMAIGISRYIRYQQALMDVGSDAIMSLDSRGKIIQCNANAERILKRKKNELLGQSMSLFFLKGENELQRLIKQGQQNDQDQLQTTDIYTELKGPNEEIIPVLVSKTHLKDVLEDQVRPILLIKDFRQIQGISNELQKQNEFVALIENYKMDQSITDMTAFRTWINDLLREVQNSIKSGYIIFFASTKENDTILEPMAFTGLSKEVEKELPHFNWKKAGFANQKGVILTSNEASLISGWYSDTSHRDMLLKGIRGKKHEFFNNPSCGIPFRIAEQYRSMLIFGPFPDHEYQAYSWAFLKKIGQTIAINSLSWLQAFYLKQREDFSRKNIDLMVHRNMIYLQEIMNKFSLVKRRSDNENIRDIAEDGKRTIKMISKITKTVLTTAAAELEIEDLLFTSCFLPTIIKNCVEGFQERIEKEKKKISLDENIDELSYAEIDPFYFTLALGNIIDNARKYSHEETEIKVSGKYDPFGETILIEVLDYGEQMSENARANFIKPGFRWTVSERAKKIPGMGLGLWDSSGIINAHNGKIDFYSVPTENNRKVHEVRVRMIIPKKH